MCVCPFPQTRSIWYGVLLAVSLGLFGVECVERVQVYLVWSVVEREFRSIWCGVLLGEFRSIWCGVLLGEFRSIWCGVLLREFRFIQCGVLLGEFRFIWCGVCWRSLRLFGILSVVKSWAMYHITIYRLYPYFGYMIHIVSFILVTRYFKRYIFA